MRQTLSVWILVLPALVGMVWAQGEKGSAQPVEWAPARPWEVIDVAIALDTSGSMQGLIDGTRLKLWEIVHDLTVLEPTPILRVALLTYGHGKNDPKAGWVRVETDLTQDLDRISERLFALTSEGGTEYVGRVLQAALEGLSWTPSEDALKLVFVAGNELADQDPQVDLRDMADVARREAIVVHAIFCGSEAAEAAQTWKELAELADGQFAVIDQRAATAVVESPFDDELAALSAAVNDTYIPLGEEGRNRRERSAEQDENTRKLSTSVAASRAQVKTSPMYSSGWDLVDAVESGAADIYELEESELPENLAAMSVEEREIYVEEMRREREALREQIAELSEKRRVYVAEQMKAKGLDDSLAFDTVVRRAIREKAEEKGFYLPEK